MSRTRLLTRAILSHLAVAVPPAVALGVLVIDVNERTQHTDAQLLHLSVAGRLRDAIEADVEARFEVLNNAERILSIPDVPLEDKTRLLRALVASGSFEWLALYAADGALDSVVRPTDGDDAPAARLEEAVRQAARRAGRAVRPPTEGERGRCILAVPLRVGDEIRGFVVGPLHLDTLAPRVESLRASFLGASGRLELVDAQARRLAASPAAPSGAVLGPHTPFEALSGAGRGLESVAAGVSTTFLDEDGEAWLASLASSTELGWVVASARPEAIAMASIAAVQRRTLLLAVVAALIAGLVGLLFARTTAAPVRALARAVRTSAKSGFESRVDSRGPPELAALGGAFNEALTKLSQYRRELRHRSQLQVRLSRQLTPSALHALLSQTNLEAENAHEERLSVIYVDLARQTPLDGAEDPIEVVRVLGELYAEACAAIEQQSGRVDQYSGDAVVGVFPNSLVGAPARAAQAAANEILRRVETLVARSPGLDVAVSVGMVSQVGQVVRSADSGELTVGGDIVERAAALQQSAGRQSIEMDDASRAELEGP